MRAAEIGGHFAEPVPSGKWRFFAKFILSKKRGFFAEFILSGKWRFFASLRMTQRRAQNDTAKGSE